MRFRVILIAGAGTMGRGIAELMALSGFEVQLWDRQPGVLGRASANIEKSLRAQKSMGRISVDQLNDTLERIRLISDLSITHPATDLVIEAIVEELAQKQRLLSELQNRLPDAWLITHTSSLCIRELARPLRRPERLVGMHFFNPPMVMPLVEIVYSAFTDRQWLEGAISLAQADLGKQTIIIKDTPGFAASRLSTTLALEAMRMVEQNVASIEDIDRAMEYGYRHPMGPLRLSDWIGLDVRLDIAKNLYRELKSDVFKPPAILERMVSDGKLGRKAGHGFYLWPTSDPL